MPMFQFRVVQRFLDCLSRQVGEALAIFSSKDNLRNSKKEYLQNCISRITVCEDTWERKERERREEDKTESVRLEEFGIEKNLLNGATISPEPDVQPSHQDNSLCNHLVGSMVT